MAQDYSKIDNARKKLKKDENSFFNFPEDIKGKHRHGMMKKLVFRFTNDEDYNFVGKTLGVETKSHNEKYKMDSGKLIELLKGKKQPKQKMRRR